LTVGEAIAQGAAAHGDTEVVFAAADGGEVRVTLAELSASAQELAGAYRRAGVEPGSTVVLQAPADPDATVALIALWSLATTVVPLVAGAAPDELTHVLREAGATTVIVAPEWRGTDLGAQARTSAASVGVERVLVIGEPLAPGTTGDVARPAPTDIAVIVYTSGSTAMPKGVQHTHETLLFGLTIMPGNDLTRMLACFPAGHVAALLSLVRPLVVGGYTVVMDRWSARAAVELIERHRITASAGTPFFLQTLLDEAERAGRDLGSLSSFLCGAAAVPPALVDRALASGIVTWRTYGSTEHPAVSSGGPDDPPDKRSLTDGRVTFGNEVRLLDDDGRDVGPGEEGEIVCRGPKQFVGYRDPTLDADAFADGTWFRTGDLGRFDDDGYLVVTDRVKDIIIRGGENISAREVEEVLLAHPGVHDVAVCPAPDPTFGEVPAAVVIGTTTLDELVAFCEAAGLASHKRPAKLVLVDELPRTPAGKVRKRDLRPLF
jgi:acyl-CoA synthetase (AMP-forming)/AMP-acid ligase II